MSKISEIVKEMNGSTLNIIVWFLKIVFRLLSYLRWRTGLRDELLFFIFIDSKKAGLIGGRTAGLLGKLGVYFTEIVLSSDFKGKGFASVAQRAFIDSLPDGIELIWGTIDSKNVSSTKTALRVGREAVRSEFFVPVSML